MNGKVIQLRRAEPPAAPSDEALVAGCARGEAAALAGLFDRYHRDVFRFLSRIAGSQGGDVDDLLQNTFLALPHASKSFVGSACVKTWIFGVAANVARRNVRGELRRRLSRLRYAQLPKAEPPLADQAAIRRQQLQQLERALAGLPHDLRTAFVLCDVEGMAGVEAARILAIPDGTLFRRLHDARKRLRTMLHERSP